jgi:hypothetical protein
MSLTTILHRLTRRRQTMPAGTVHPACWFPAPDQYPEIVAGEPARHMGFALGDDGRLLECYQLADGRELVRLSPLEADGPFDRDRAF